MSEFLAACLIDLAVYSLAAAAFVVWYKMTVGNDAQLKAYQYRFFALRDRAIRLVASGQMEESDPRWQELYKHMNESARAASVNSMRNGLSFVLGILRNLRPLTAEEIDQSESLPCEAKQLYGDFVRTVLRVCVEGSAILRLVLWLAQHVKRIKRWLEWHNPDEVRNYRRWLAADERFEASAC